METIVCSKCGKELKRLDNMFREIPDLDLWNGNVCLACKQVYCSECIKVGGPTPCPNCGTPTKPAQRQYLREIGQLAKQNIIEVEAESLDEARKKAKSQIPEGLDIISEEIISDGKPKTVKAIADTTEEAFTKAQGDIPANAHILEKIEVSKPGQKVVIVEAFDEESARAQAANQVGKTAIVNTIRLTIAGKQGFLGVGKKPNQYEAEVFQPAEVNISYKTNAKISARTGKTFRGSLVLIFNETHLLEELKKLGMSEGEAYASLLAAKQAVQTLSYNQKDKLLYTEPITGDNLAIKWVIYHSPEQELLRKSIDDLVYKRK